MEKIMDKKLCEKLTFLYGKDNWSLPKINGIDTLRMSDGPHGLRYVYKEENWIQYSKENRAYPSLSTLANSWNKDVLYSIGECIALDCIEENVDIILAPGVNLKRHPFCGRNFEYISEDSYLAGKLGASYIKGVQDKGVAACIKHYACNNRERDRFFESSEVDIRALHEEYLKAFKIAIKESNPYSLMCSYNPVNGIYASENSYLLKDILRDEFNFKGVTISDWGATRNRAVSLKNGIDISMPYSPNFLGELENGLNKGYLTLEDIDGSIKRIDNLRAILEKEKNKRVITLTKKERLSKSIEAMKESIVLLKNENNMLPLNKKEQVLVVGDYAINPPIGGDGSSKINPLKKESNLIEALKNYGSEVHFESAFNKRYGLFEPFGVKKAVLEAKKVDKVIVCVGTSELIEKEETDKDNYRLNENIYEIIKRLYEVNENLIVCLYTGGAVEIEEIKENSKGIVYCGLGGEGVNEALASILMGEVSPSGKLSESFIKIDKDSYANRGNFFYEKYDEGVLVGYKYYLTKGIEVSYPFGYGLTYANFIYSNLKIEKLENYKVKVSFDIKNESDIEAKCVSEIYVGNRERMIETSSKSLVHFEKTLLKPHEIKNICFILDDDAFSYYSTILKRNYVEEGIYKIYVSSSLLDDELVGEVEFVDDNEFKFARF